MLADRLIRWFSRSVPSAAINAVTDISAALATDTGLKRGENQDRVAAIQVRARSRNLRSFRAFAVLDGMGGMRDGGRCATLAVAHFFQGLVRLRGQSVPERLRSAVLQANEAVFKFAGGAGGATLVALLIEDDAVWHVHAGDSRLYGLRTSPPEFNRLTIDDSLEEAFGGRGRELLQFIGMGPELSPHVSQAPTDYKNFVITSDGVHYLPFDAVQLIVANAPDVHEGAKRLIDLARWSGSPDNASVAVVDTKALPPLRPDAIDESEIQVWDAYGALQIVWAKEEQPLLQSAPNPDVTPASVPSHQDADIERATPPDDRGEHQQAIPNKDVEKKPRAKRKRISKTDEAQPELQISISEDGDEQE